MLGALLLRHLFYESFVIPIKLHHFQILGLPTSGETHIWNPLHNYLYNKGPPSLLSNQVSNYVYFLLDKPEKHQWYPSTTSITSSLARDEYDSFSNSLEVLHTLGQPILTLGMNPSPMFSYSPSSLPSILSLIQSH